MFSIFTYLQMFTKILFRSSKEGWEAFHLDNWDSTAKVNRFNADRFLWLSELKHQDPQSHLYICPHICWALPLLPFCRRLLSQVNPMLWWGWSWPFSRTLSLPCWSQGWDLALANWVNKGPFQERQLPHMEESGEPRSPASCHPCPSHLVILCCYQLFLWLYRHPGSLKSGI